MIGRRHTLIPPISVPKEIPRPRPVFASQVQISFISRIDEDRSIWQLQAAWKPPSLSHRRDLPRPVSVTDAQSTLTSSLVSRVAGGTVSCPIIFFFLS